MTSEVDGLALVEREEAHGRVRLALESGADEVCWLTVDPLRVHDGAGGTVELRGIGNVNTEPAHRRRGLASRLLEAAIERMRATGAAGSLLYGIDGFYDRFGWSSWGDERWVEVPLAALPDRRAGRAMVEEDRAQLTATYATVSATTTGADDRSSGRAWAQLRPAGVEVVERDGELVGWAWLGAGGVPERDAQQQRSEAGSVVFAELQAVDDQAMLDVLAAAARRARAHDPAATRIVTGAPERHPLRRLARRGAIDCRLVDEVRPHGGAMLLPFDEVGSRLADAAAPFQFLPDRF